MLRKIIEKQPPEHWGNRVLQFENGKVTLTTEHAHHLVLKDRPAFQITREACDLQRLTEALSKKRKPEQTDAYLFQTAQTLSEKGEPSVLREIR